MKNFSVRTKLYITMAVSILCTAIIGLYVLFAMLALNDSYTGVIGRVMAELQTQADIISATEGGAEMAEARSGAGQSMRDLSAEMSAVAADHDTPHVFSPSFRGRFMDFLYKSQRKFDKSL